MKEESERKKQEDVCEVKNKDKEIIVEFSDVTSSHSQNVRKNCMNDKKNLNAQSRRARAKTKAREGTIYSGGSCTHC